MIIISRLGFLAFAPVLTKTCASSSSCSSPLAVSSRSMTTTTMNLTPQDLVGKLFDIEYKSEHSQDTYRFVVENDHQIVWKRVLGSNVGQGDREEYVITHLTSSKILMTWIEADGLGLSNVLDFTAGTCLTHGNNGRNVWKHKGKLTLLQDDNGEIKQDVMNVVVNKKE